VFLFSPYLIHAARFPILPLLISVTIFSISDSDRLLWGSLLRGFFLHFGSFFSILKDWSVKLFQDKTGISLSDFFATEDAIADVNSYDGSLMEKVKAIEALSDEEKKTVFSIVDAFAGKKKLNDALSGVLSDVK
jgi:hypothetical protein